MTSIRSLSAGGVLAALLLGASLVLHAESSALPPGNLSPETERVLTILEGHVSDIDPTFQAESYLSKLTPPQQLEVARRLSADPSAAYVRYGVLLLVRLKHTEEAIAPIANLLLSGKDINGLFWSWVHYDDPCLTDSMSLRLGRYLLSRHGTLQGAERKRAEEYLAAGEPGGRFRAGTAQANLNAIEARMEQRRCRNSTVSAAAR
jgi:hypothetical protein